MGEVLTRSNTVPFHPFYRLNLADGVALTDRKDRSIGFSWNKANESVNDIDFSLNRISCTDHSVTNLFLSCPGRGIRSFQTYVPNRF